MILICLASLRRPLLYFAVLLGAGWIASSFPGGECADFAGFAAQAHAQPASSVRIPAESFSSANVDAILAAGGALEREGRWGEALSHFESAARKHPGVAEFEHRATLARIHYDVGHRYADSSFLSDLRTLTSNDSVKTYEEVLSKIDGYFVKPPSWSDLALRGVMNMEIALTEPAFVQRHLAGVEPARIEAFRREIGRLTDYREVNSQQAARNAAVLVANEGYRRLGLTPTATMLEFVAGAVGGLDHYSSFLTAAQLDDLYCQIEGNFVGMGVELKADAGSLLIVNALAGSPAEQAGIRSGDRIVAVEGRTTQEISTDRAADILKGEEGTWVNVTVRSPGGAVRDLRVQRRRVEVPSVENVRIADEGFGVGYLRIGSFQKTTPRDMEAALWRLHRQGMRSLIIDVRGNPGGLLTASVEVADKFLKEGMIVSTRGRSPQEDFDYRAHQVGTWRPPLIVLIDGNTASAAEIFAGAIADHRRGTVLGERSYGKGSVQGIFPLANQRHGVRLTTAKFYSPSGRAISDRGVLPDMQVTQTLKPQAGSSGAVYGGSAATTANAQPDDDPVLTAALQLARRRLAERN